MNILLVGRRPEAYWASARLTGLEGVERVFHLKGADTERALDPLVLSPRVEPPSELLQQSLGSVELGSCLLRDRWGKKILTLKLPSFAVRSFPGPLTLKHEKLSTLPESVELGRLQTDPEGLQFSLSDGSELSVAYAVFADGENSRARAYAEPSQEAPADPAAVSCWSFQRPDLLGLKEWEFRWALGKSVEQVPLPDGRVWVKVRFRSPYGSRLTIGELKELFSEFGADMEALFDGVTEEQVRFGFERRPELVTFRPTPRILTVGRACWGSAFLQTFDWEASFLERQFDLLGQALEQRCDWDSYTRGLMAGWQSREKAERYLRTVLHYDNSLLRPLRDFFVAALPSTLVAPHFERRLELAEPGL